MTVRVGIVGCGEVSRAKHLPVFAHIRGATVAALCDLDQDLAKATASRFGVPRVAGSAAEMLAWGEIDLIAVLTDPASHAALAIAALRAGHHVYVEKPLALNVDDSEAMLSEARRSGRIAVTGFHMRFHRLLREARDIVRSGRLGTIESIRVVWHSPRGDQQTQAWKTTRDTGGGALVEIGVHHIDLVRFLLLTARSAIKRCFL